jgi:The GLUG motif
MSAAMLEFLLTQGSVTIATNNTQNMGDQFGDIFLDANVNVTWNNNNSLTLNAYRDIRFALNSSLTNTAGGSLVLRADSTGTGTGTVKFESYPYPSPGHVDFSASTGTVSVFYNPGQPPLEVPPGQSKYEIPTAFRCASGVCAGIMAQPSQLTAYMLVNNASDLNAVRTNQAGTYALALNRPTPLDAGSIPNFAPISNFTGVFDGQGQTISNLTIAPNNSTTHDFGLFGVIGAAGVVRDLNLANINVTANPGVTFQTVGTLAGTNLGTVSGVTADGTVNGGTATDAALGGLVGANGNFGFGFGSGPGSITNSHADVDVSSASINVALGGLVGFNAPGSIIFGSSASGDVIATASVNKGGEGCGFSNSCQHVSAGGLVGDNLGTIAFSFAIGDVSVGSNGTAGGLVGFNSGIVSNAVAAGNVTGAAGTGGVDG